jgi:hypothetical protein
VLDDRRQRDRCLDKLGMTLGMTGKRDGALQRLGMHLSCGLGTGVVNVVATPTNGVVSFGRFINQ